jgi:hypothetical protein
MIARAEVGQWKTYTSKRQVRDVVVNRGVVWAATSGGLFSYDPQSARYTQYATSEGLKTIDLTAVTADGAGTIWIGSAGGFVQSFDPASNRWQSVSDIALRTDPNKRINALAAVGDTLFILSDIGLSIFSVSRMEFRATYSRFGPGLSPIVGGVTGIAFYRDDLWVSTRSGLASTPFNNANPSAPESWTVFSAAQGLPSTVCNGLAVAFDTLFAATGNGLAAFNGAGWNAVAGTAGMTVVDIATDTKPTAGQLLLHLLTADRVWVYGNGTLASVAGPLPNEFTAIGTEEVVGTRTRGVAFIPALSFALPPGPPSNKFVGIAVDERGVVWSGTGSANGEGFMSFNGTAWRSYTAASDPRLSANEYYKVNIGPGNVKWVSGWGPGVALVGADGEVAKVFNTKNGIPPSVPNDTNFAVVGGVATDQDGIAWIANRTAPDSTAVIRFLPDSSLHYTKWMSMRAPYRVFADIMIDQNGTKWFANFSRFEPEVPIALFYYNESIRLPGTLNGWGALTLNDGLTSNRVSALAADRDGQVWIGSEQGISIIYDPTFPAGSIAPYHPLRDQTIQQIMVDPLNDKWVATKQGVFILSSDGTTILDHITSESTDGRLLDDDVASIAMDPSTGTIYFGTEKGLSSLATPAVTPNRSFDGLGIAPNPFYLPGAQLTIDGLVENSLVKILSIDGSLVREFRTPGGRVGFWDGRNDKGDLVATAVYVIVAYSEDGSKVATGKVAVVRR